VLQQLGPRDLLDLSPGTLNDPQVGLDLMILGGYAVAALAGGGVLLRAGLRYGECTSGFSGVGRE
jgi:hypothetical protein